MVLAVAIATQATIKHVPIDRLIDRQKAFYITVTCLKIFRKVPEVDLLYRHLKRASYILLLKTSIIFLSWHFNVF